MYSLIDCREEFFVRLYRCWIIVSILGVNRKGERVLSIKKAAFFDFLVRNSALFHDFLVKFDRISEEVPFKETLYSSNISYGEFQNYHDFLKSVLVLENEGFLEVSRSGDDFFVSVTDKVFIEVKVVSPAWEINVALLKPLVNKSLSVLYKGVLRT